MDELPESAKVYLYDADIPRPFSLSNSTVYVYWYLTVQVQDVLGSAIGGAAVEVSYTRNGTTVASGSTNDDGRVRIPLLGSLVGKDGERFVGNYQVVVSNPKNSSDRIVGYVGLDSGKTLQVTFPESLLPPTGVEVEASVANTTIVSGTNFTVRGDAVATFPAGRRPLSEGAVTIRLLSNATPIWQNATQLDADGMFALVVPAPEKTGAYTIEVQVTGTGAFAGVEGRAHVIAIEIVEPAPTRIVVVLEAYLINPFYLGDPVVVRGTVRYNDAQGRPVPGARVFVKDTPTMNTRQQAADGVGAFELIYDSPVNVGQWDYIVHARDEKLGLQSDQVKLTLVAVEPAKVKETGVNKVLLGVVIAIIVAVLVVGAIMAQMLLSSKGKMVECGECGTLVPETAKVCPKCGTEFETDVAKCSECGSWIKAESPECPYCGTKFRDLKAKGDEDDEDEEGEAGGKGGGKAGGKGGGKGEEPPVIVDLPPASSAVVEGAVTTPEGTSSEAATLADSAKRAPEGIAGTSYPVVTKKAMASGPEGAQKAAEGEPRPRVRKVSRPPAQSGDEGKGEGGR
jgi:RNA polymerase subunit RPABC4/transcription elongation factor Spt4